jgi:predicted RNA-binding protein with TRAM domain
MKKSLSYLALVGIVASFGAGAVGSAPASAATLSNATRLVLDTSGGDPNGGIGEAGIGDAGGVSTTLTASGTRWTVFESLSSDIVTGDTNGASDVFVTNGTTVTRLSVSANGDEGGSGLNSYDPEICSTGRKVAYVTENDFDIADVGNSDVYVIDRDADEDGIFDEFSQENAVTVTLVSVSYDSDFDANISTADGAYSPRFSSDCTKIAFVTDTGFDADDLNTAPDVYMNTLGSVATPAVWVSTFADGGGDGGGFLPALNADGTKVTFVTEFTDLVFSGGELGGLIVSTVGASSVTAAAYASVKPDGNPSTGQIDTDSAPAISADGKCIAFKSTQGVDLLAGNLGPAEGIFLWDNRGASPVVSLISKITTGQAATSATAPRITDDCSFIAYESNDEFISAADNNNKLDVFLYDVANGTTQLISSNADGDSADANSSLAALDYDPTTGQGVVMITSGASNIRGVAGGNQDLDLFAVPFDSTIAPAGAPTALVATPGNARASIAFTAPTSTGGAAITNYEYSTNNGTTWKALSPIDFTSPVVITTRSDATTALVNGTTYQVKLRAVNSAGSGTASVAVSVKPRTTAGAPTALVATAGVAKATITFKAPTSTGGAAITNYEYSTNNGTTWKALSPIDFTSPVVITTRSDATTALVNGTTYQVKLRAVNSAGSGTASVAVSVKPRTTAGAPTALVATAGVAKATITFKAPTSTGGAAITNYEYSTNNGTTWKALSPKDFTSPVVITKRSDATTALVKGKMYKVKLRAVNSAGSGTPSAAVTVTPK